MKEIYAELRLRNNLLRQRRLAHGMTSAAMAEACGMTLSDYSGLETMRLSPLTSGRGRFGRPEAVRWRARAKRVAEYHGVSCEELWPDVVLAVKQPVIAREMAAEEVAALARLGAEPASYTMDGAVDAARLPSAAADWLAKLRPREAEAVRLKFGLDDGEALTFREVGERMRNYATGEPGIAPAAARKWVENGLRRLRDRPEVREWFEAREHDGST